MKKILFVLLATLLIASFAYAEQSAQTYSPNSLQIYREQQVFADFYNNSGSDISSNYVVILDTSTTNTASGSSLGTYITMTATANSPLTVGVTDAYISNGKVGRVCVRGPHKCYLTGLTYTTVGASLSTTTTSGAGSNSTNLTNPGVFAVLLNPDPITGSSATLPVGGQGSQGGFQNGDGTSNYWVWVGNVGLD